MAAFEPKAFRRFATPCGLFLLALAIRLLYLLDGSDSPSFSTPIVDALKHHELALEIAEGGGFDALFSLRRPFFYPLFLSSVYTLFGPSIVAAKLIQSLVGAATCVLTWSLGVRIFGPATGLLAGLIVAGYGPLFFWELELVGAGWAAFWSVGLMVLLLDCATRPTPLRAAALGLCGALAIATRPGFLLFFALACVWLIATRLGSIAPARRRAATVGALALGFCTVAGPLSVASQAIAGHAGFLPAAGGLNAYVGNNPNRCETLALQPGAEFFDLAEQPIHAGHRSVSEQSRYFYARVLDYASADPGGFARGLAAKGLEFANGREIPRNVDLYVFREWSGMLAATIGSFGGLALPWGILFPLAWVGIVWRWHEIPVPMRLFAGLYPLLLILVFVASRHRIPVVPIFAVFAAAAATGIFDALRGGRWRPASLAATAALTLAVVLAALPHPCPESSSSRSELFSYLGTGAVNEGTPERVRHYAAEALADPEPSHLAYELMAWILINEGDAAGAISHLDTSLAMRRSSWPLTLRARAYLNRDDLESAERDLKAALKRRPGNARALFLRGEVYYRRGELVEARERWRQAAAAGGAAGRRAQERLAELPAP